MSYHQYVINKINYFKLKNNAFARNGTLRLLKFAREQIHQIPQIPRIPWSSDTCTNTAKGGHLNVLEWLRSQNPPCLWDRYTCLYAKNNEIKDWIRHKTQPFRC